MQAAMAAEGTDVGRFERERAAHEDAVKALRDAFPEMDGDVVDTILFNNRGDAEAAAQALLAMSDPAYRPDEAEAARMQAVERDAAYARRVAERELHRTARHSQPPPQPPRNSSSASPSESARRSSRIRDIFRRHRARSHSSGGGGLPPVPVSDAAAAAGSERALGSDFSDSDPSPLAAAAAAARPPVNLLEDDAASGLAVYEPLSPSKAAPRSPAPPPPADPAPAAEPLIDLDNPFANNPLLPAAAAAANPFAAAEPPPADTNPFRNRRT